jgi:hypothetical protein
LPRALTQIWPCRCKARRVCSPGVTRSTAKPASARPTCRCARERESERKREKERERRESSLTLHLISLFHDADHNTNAAAAHRRCRVHCRWRQHVTSPAGELQARLFRVNCMLDKIQFSVLSSALPSETFGVALFRYGALGDGTVRESLLPCELSLAAPVERVYAGPNTCAAVRTGQATRSHSIPIPSSDLSYLQVTRDGRLWTWGQNQWGQLGREGDPLRPMLVEGVDGRVGMVSCGFAHTLAICGDP